MIISELIEKLKELQTEHGDLEVGIYDGDEFCDIWSAACIDPTDIPKSMKEELSAEAWEKVKQLPRHISLFYD